MGHGPRLPGLRRTALWLLGYVPEPDGLDLPADAARDPDARVRSVTVGAIGSHTETSARAVDLLTALLADPGPQLRVSALSTLGFARRPGRHHPEPVPRPRTGDLGRTGRPRPRPRHLCTGEGCRRPKKLAARVM
ncbi:HEAT repeat domain-containing protein [Streptomyces sp. NPDC002276]